jgi:predicted AAA+ superfamily ATPase
LTSDDAIIQNQGMEYRSRFLEKRVVYASEALKVILILGARQVGKSTLLRYLLPKAEVFVFDSILDPYQAKSDPDLFLDLHPIPLLLDEVQFAPALLSAIKRRVDLSTQPGQYFLTGSQNLMMLKSISETMTGRVALLHLEGMSLLERLGLGNEESWLFHYIHDPEKFMKTRLNILDGLPSLTEVIWRGAFPQSIELPISQLPVFFNSYIQTYVERDIRLVEKMEDLGRFGEFISLLGALSAQEINYSQLGRELGLTPQTAKRWLFALTASYQWREILPLHRNAIKRISEKRKGFLTDSGIACYLLRIRSPEDLALHPALGALFETWVVNHIHQLFSSFSLTPAVYHWRTHSGAEIDLVLELNGIYFPIEIKCSRNLSNYDLRSFKAFRASLPKSKIAPGLIIYAGDENYPLDHNTLALSWKAA